MAAPFKFDILVQLANIPMRIIIHELLCHSKETMVSLWETLANSESFLTHILFSTKSRLSTLSIHQVSAILNITFTSEDMLVKSSDHNHPFYYTGYIGCTKVERILIDLGFTLNIMSVHLLQFFPIPIHKLAATKITIYGFNAQSSQLVRKIHLK